MARTVALTAVIGAALTAGFQGTVGGAGRQLERLGNAVGALGLQRNTVTRFRELGRATFETRRAWREAETRVAALAREMAATARPSRQLRQSFAQAQRQATAASRRYRDNRDALSRLRAELRDAGIDTRQLGQESQRLGRALESLQRRQQALQRVEMARAGVRERRTALRGQMTDAVALGGALYGTLRPAIAFEAAMAKLGAITRASSQDMTVLTAKARELGASTRYSASEAAGAMTFLGMAGFKTNDILQATPGLLDLATAGAMDLGQTADIASNILSGFGLKAGEIGRVGDVMAAAFTTSNVDLSMLGETMKFVAPVASAAGAGIEEVAAMAGLLGNVGIQGSMAGTALRAAFSRLSAPAGEAAKTLGRLGVSTVDASGDLRAMPDLLREFALATDHMGGAERADVIKRVFGEEPAAAITELLKQAAGGGLDAYIAELRKAKGTVGTVAARMNANTAGALKELGSALESVAISLGTTLLPMLTDGARVFADIAGKIAAFSEQNPVLTKVVVGAAAGLVGLKVAAIGLGYAWTFLHGGVLTVVSVIQRFRSVLALAQAGMLAFQGSGAVGGLMTGLRGIGGAFLSLARGAIPAVVMGMRTLTVAFMTNPIGLVIGGIALAAGLIISNWDKVGPYFTRLWDWIKWSVLSAWAFIEPVVQFTPLGAIVAHWGPIRDFIGGLFGGLWGLVEPVISAIGNAVAWVGGQIGAVIAYAKQAGAWLADSWVGQAAGAVGEGIGDIFGGDGDGTARPVSRPAVAAGVVAGTTLAATAAPGAALSPPPPPAQLAPRTVAASTTSPTPLATVPDTGPARPAPAPVTVNITVNAVPGMDTRAIADEVARRLRDTLSRQALRQRGALHD